MNNVVGKILIVMQLVFSLCFMCFAGAVYTFQSGWKVKAVTAQGTVTSLQADLKSLADAKTDEIAKLKADIEAMKTRAEMAEATVTKTDTDLKEAQKSLANAELQRDKHLADLVIAQQEAQSRIAETTDLRSQTKRLHDQVIDGIAQRRTLEDQLLERQGQIEESAQREEQHLKSMARYREVFRYNNIDPDEPIAGPIPAQIEKVTGVVKAAKKNDSRSAELVEISVGSDDKITKKMKLIVYRGAKYICEIEVTAVEPDTAVGRVIEETRRGTIERGDNVTTKL